MAPSTSLKALLVASALTGLTGFTLNAPITFKPSTTSLDAMRRGRPRGPVRTIEVKPTMNDEIKHDQLRVSVPNLTPTDSGRPQKDEQLGVLSKAEALAKAKELGGLDVILINEQSDPPVVKIVDYSKFRYEKEKKAKEAKKNSRTSELKEVKMSYKIDVHDYGVRIKNASKFLKQGNRVKCTVQFKGREMQHDRLGFQLLDKMTEEMIDICTMEGKPKRDGRFLSCVLSPRPEVTKTYNDMRRAEEKEKKRNKRMNKKNKANKDGTGTPDKKFNADDDDDDDDASLDELLGSDTATDELFN
jgi:translation initiation factor IF-3